MDSLFPNLLLDSKPCNTAPQIMMQKLANPA